MKTNMEISLNNLWEVKQMRTLSLMKACTDKIVNSSSFYFTFLGISQSEEGLIMGLYEFE
jgi:hypothetical protein